MRVFLPFGDMKRTDGDESIVDVVNIFIDADITLLCEQQFSSEFGRTMMAYSKQTTEGS